LVSPTLRALTFIETDYFDGVTHIAADPSTNAAYYTRLAEAKEKIAATLEVMTGDPNNAGETRA
jgi:hypothetical protein